MRTAIQQMILRGMQRLGDVREVITYSQVTAGTYDTDSGTVSKTTTSVQCPALFTDYTLKEKDLAQGQIQKEDMRVLIVPSELSLTPQFEDTLERPNGEVWRIVKEGLSKDPSDALIIMQVRKYSGGA